jgi:hypothetical protein
VGCHCDLVPHGSQRRPPRTSAPAQTPGGPIAKQPLQAGPRSAPPSARTKSALKRRGAAGCPPAPRGACCRCACLTGLDTIFLAADSEKHFAWWFNYCFPESIYFDQHGMIELRQQAGLVHKAAQPGVERLGVSLRQHRNPALRGAGRDRYRQVLLQRDPPPQRAILSEIDDAEAAFTDQPRPRTRQCACPAAKRCANLQVALAILPRPRPVWPGYGPGHCRLQEPLVDVPTKAGTDFSCLFQWPAIAPRFQHSSARTRNPMDFAVLGLRIRGCRRPWERVVSKL